MRHFGQKIVNTLIGITCDCCGDRHEDVIETQEFLSFHTTAGYGNMAFGDMNKLDLDLCQYCQKKLLGDYIKVSEHYTIEQLQQDLHNDGGRVVSSFDLEYKGSGHSDQ